MSSTIPRAMWDAYARALAAQAAGAKGLVASSMRSWLARNPGAGVADARDYAIQLLSQALGAYGARGAALAASMYDRVAASLGLDLDPADSHEEDPGPGSEAVARYQAGRLAAGDAEGFSAQLGDFAADWTGRMANETVIDNAGRPRDMAAGVRFARVLSGAENCTFCTMLASRGFVYHTRRTAGEFRRFHRHCDCRVVMGLSGTQVEDYDLDAIYERWRAFEDIDAATDEDGNRMPKAWRDEEKRRYAAAHPVWARG